MDINLIYTTAQNRKTCQVARQVGLQSRFATPGTNSPWYVTLAASLDEELDGTEKATYSGMEVYFAVFGPSAAVLCAGRYSRFYFYAHVMDN